MRTIRDGEELGQGGEADTGVAPGKRARTEALPGTARAPVQALLGDVAAAPGVPAPVQAKAADAFDFSYAREQGGEREGVHAAAEVGISGSAGTLPFLDQIQASFGEHDVGHVRAHQDERAAAGAGAMGAAAFATGNDVAFASAPSLHTAAHEAAHVVQQRGGVQLAGGVGQAADAYEQHADRVADLVVKGESAEGLLGKGIGGGGGGGQAVQRYEAGEHAKTGDTQANLKAHYAPIEYTVVKGDTLAGIAKKSKISVEELKSANADKLQTWPAAKGGDGEVEGFNAGETIAIPQQLNEMQKDAVKDTQIKVKVNGAELDYGTLIAMGGDLFGSPEEMAKCPKEELLEIAALVEEEKKTGKPVSTERWEKATKGRFLKLAAANEAHFAPSNAAFAPVGGHSAADHKSSWEQHHASAINAARAGNKDQALMLNAFADHFLTDAFAAGHLFNKSDAMDQFNSHLPREHKAGVAAEEQEFTAGSKVFFDAIANAVFTGDLAAQFSIHEATSTEATHGLFHPNIDSASRFSILLQGVHKKRPDLMSSAVAKNVHDNLNGRKGGLPVENLKDEKWELSGDNTMNPRTLAVCQKAVARSQENVLESFRSKAEVNIQKLYEQVWDFTPRTTAASTKIVHDTVTDGTDVSKPGLRQAIIDLINANWQIILRELVAMGELQRA